MIVKIVTVFWHIAFTNLYHHVYFFVHLTDNPRNYVMVMKNDFSSKQKTIIYFHLLFEVSKLSRFICQIHHSKCFGQSLGKLAGEL